MVLSRKEQTRFDDYADMLADRVRMDAFEAAIHKVVREGDVVVDLGAGLGVLGFIALKAGASKVYAIEQRDSIRLARQVAEHNGLADRVVFLEKSSRDCKLPEGADVLVSETLGSFAVDENTLAFTIDARERFLKPGAAMIPSALKLWVTPVEVPEVFARRVDVWREVAGIDYSPAIDAQLSKLLVDSVDTSNLLAAPQLFAAIDLMEATPNALRGSMRFRVERDGVLHGLGGWFEAFLCDDVVLNTAPDQPTTHWKQAVFPLRAPVPVSSGDVLEVELSIKPKSPISDDTIVSYVIKRG